MVGKILSHGLEAAQIVVLFTALVQGFRYARRSDNKLYLIFYAMAMAAFLCSDLYYLAHLELREGLRVPFAPDDIANFGLFLLLGSFINAALDQREQKPAVTAAAAVFAAANVALWIAWSGEWLRDILGGLSHGYCLCAAALSLWRTRALSRGEWTGLAVLCAAVIAAGAGTVKTSDWSAALEFIGYGLMGFGMLWLLVRALFSLRGKDPDRALSLCFGLFCWNTVLMYMSAGNIYYIASNLTTFSLVILLLAVRKKVNAA